LEQSLIRSSIALSLVFGFGNRNILLTAQGQQVSRNSLSLC